MRVISLFIEISMSNIIYRMENVISELIWIENVKTLKKTIALLVKVPSFIDGS